MNRITFVVFLAIGLSACSTSPSKKDDDLGSQEYNKEGEIVAETLDKLKSDPHVRFRIDGGWTIANSDSELTIWYFSPEVHPAHPAYVKNIISEKNGAVAVEISARCGAEKSACDKLLQDFSSFNDRTMKAWLESK